MTEATIHQIEANGNFPFTFYIEKAVADEVDSELILEGVASTTNIDHDNERMSKEALHAMANIINEKSVPLRVEHSKSDNAVIGSVFKAWVDERNQLHIRASLDKSHPVSATLHYAMKSEGKKMGFSVGGLVKKAVKEFSDQAGKLVKTFYDVELKEVSVTPRPANYDSWAISKSIARDEAEASLYRGTAIFDEFLFENPSYDYLKAFAKSVPDDAWHKVESPSITKNENNMTKIEVKKAEDTKPEVATEETKSVSRQEFGVVVKGIETLAKAFEAFVSKMDSTTETDASAKKTSATDTETDAKKAFPADTETDTKKASESDTETKPEEKATSTDGKTDTYDIATVERSINTLEALSKKLEGMKKAEGAETQSETDTKTKATGDEDEKETWTKTWPSKDEDDKETTKGMHPLDRFVLSVTKTMEQMNKAMEARGMNIVGYQKSIVDSVVNDPAMQVEIAKMMKVPGKKQSVAMGVPYMVTKEGKRFALSATEVGVSTIEKSRSTDKPVSFKDMYKKDFSSVRETED
jgi:hypothetical protein